MSHDGLQKTLHKDLNLDTQTISDDREPMFTMPSDRTNSYDVYLSNNVLDPDNSLVLDVIGNRQTLLVTTPTVAQIYGPDFELLAQRGRLIFDTLVLECNEQNKSLNSVDEVCRRALQAELGRDSVIVVLGGGVCSDIVTLAASMIRRGIAYVRIPTTLLGQVDASIGIKGGANFCGKKNYLGCFYPPSAVVIDPHFLKTLPINHLCNGFAEIIKIAIACDVELFDLIATHHEAFLRTALQEPSHHAQRVMWLATRRMLEELQPNLFEDKTYRRLVDLGHTFSPAIEAASNFSIHHGEAVAIDMALSATVSAELNLISGADFRKIVSTIASIGLPIFSNVVTLDLCLEALNEASRHRGGSLNLVLPITVGQVTFLEHKEDLPRSVLRASLDRLAQESQCHNSHT
jgi:3-dehydroquinate synthetase